MAGPARRHVPLAVRMPAEQSDWLSRQGGMLRGVNDRVVLREVSMTSSIVAKVVRALATAGSPGSSSGTVVANGRAT